MVLVIGFFFVVQLQRPHQCYYVLFRGLKEERNDGYISQEFDMLVVNGLRWRVLLNGVANWFLGVLLLAQIFYIASINISATYGPGSYSTLRKTLPVWIRMLRHYHIIFSVFLESQVWFPLAIESNWQPTAPKASRKVNIFKVLNDRWSI